MATKRYHSDKPITTQEEDLFSRQNFAQNIVKIISSFDIDENFVVGLYAKWGMGKTSTINLIQKEFSSNDSLVGIYINAWTLGGSTERILWEILDQISLQITGTSVQTRIKKIGQQISEVSSGVLPFDIDTEFDLIGEGRDETKVSLGKIANSVGYVGRLLASTDGIRKAKERVEATIKERGVKAVVFIDDIDRLGKNQIADVFRLINNIANYKGVTFVLAFDKEYVSAALEDQLPKGQSGDDYLEKIIQVPLHLPAIHRSVLDGVFAKKLSEVLAATGISIDQSEIGRFNSLYYASGLNHYIRSPRAINKMMNVLYSVLPINHFEANTVDSIAIETIRVFDESFYNNIRDNKDLLTANRDNDSYNNSDEKKAKLRARVTKAFGEDNTRRFSILKELFPRVQSIMHDFGGEEESALRQSQRIASRNYFDIFFSHFDESYGISDRKLISILESDANEELSIINEQNFMVAMQTINDNYTKVINTLDFSKSLLDVAARLPNEEASAFSLAPLEKVLFTIDDLLKTSPTKLSDYSELLTYNFNQGRIESLPYIIRQVVLYSQEERSNDSPILNEQDLDTYKTTALEIIRKTAEAGKMPLNTTQGHYFLYSYWADFGEKAEIETYLKKHLKTADNAVDFISQFLGKWSNLSGDNSYFRSDFDKTTYKVIGRYIDQEFLYNLITKSKTYTPFVGINVNSLNYLDRHKSGYNARMESLSRAGNEHTPEFREVIAKQFIYIHENLDESMSD